MSNASDSPPDWRHAPGTPTRRASRATLASVRAAGGSIDLATTVRRPIGQQPPALIGSALALHRNKLYVVGGKNASTGAFTNDVYSLDLDSLVYEHVFHDPSSPDAPEPRYFHSASTYRDNLVIYGGMGPVQTNSPDVGTDDDEEEAALPVAEGALRLFDHVFLFNVITHTWSSPATALADFLLSPPAGRYAHLATVTQAGHLVITGGQAVDNSYINDVAILDLESFTWLSSTAVTDVTRLGSSRAFFASSPLQVHQPAHILPYSAPHTDGPPLYLFANSIGNSAAKRTLHTMRPPKVALTPALVHPPMGDVSPPSLRFPRGEIIGRHLIVAGIVISPLIGASCQVWALDLAATTWRQLNVGRVVEGGAWTRSIVWRNKLILVGDAEGDLAFDFERRQTTFFSIAMVELEAFGIWQPPRLALSPVAQELALEALSQPALADFAIICSDKRRLGCSKRLLEDRWPWLRERLRKVTGTYLPGGSDSEDEVAPPLRRPQSGSLPRFTARNLELSDTSDVVLPALRYFYALSLPADLSVELLSSLLCFAQAYSANHLRGLTIHALHVALERDPLVAPQVHEAAAVGQCTALQLRALSLLGRRPTIATGTGSPFSSRPSTMLYATSSPSRSVVSAGGGPSSLPPPRSLQLPQLPDDVEATPRPSSTAYSPTETGTDISSRHPYELGRRTPPYGKLSLDTSASASATTSFTSATSSSSAAATPPSKPLTTSISPTSSSSTPSDGLARLTLAPSSGLTDWNAPVRTPKAAMSAAVSNLLGLRKSQANLRDRASSLDAERPPPVPVPVVVKEKVYYTGRGGAGKISKPAAVKEQERQQKVNRQEAALRASGVSNEVEIALWRIGELQGKDHARRARAHMEELTAQHHEQQHGGRDDSALSIHSTTSSMRSRLAKASKLSLRH